MDSESLIYRKNVKHSDLQNVQKIVESSGFFSPEELEVATYLVQDRLAKGMRSGYQFLFAQKEGDVVGYACFGHISGTMDSYDLYWIAVHNDLRGTGIGKKLLTRAEQEIARRGGQRIYIETSSRDMYAPTRSFYQRCAYRQEALLKDFYSPGDAKIIYVKELNSAAPPAPSEPPRPD